MSRPETEHTMAKVPKIDYAVSLGRAAKALEMLASLKFIVECKRSNYFEPIAAFDCEPAADGYARECREANARVHPDTIYRVVNLED